MVHLHLWCFQSAVGWKESAKSLLAFGTTDVWKERPSTVDFKLLDSNKSSLWVAKIKSTLFKGVENSIQKNLKLTLIYLTLSPKQTRW